jgi:hypothetical protein
MRLVQEEIAVAGRCFRILVDGDDDRLDVLITPTLPRTPSWGFLLARYWLARLTAAREQTFRDRRFGAISGLMQRNNDDRIIRAGEALWENRDGQGSLR